MAPSAQMLVIGKLAAADWLFQCVALAISLILAVTLDLIIPQQVSAV